MSAVRKLVPSGHPILREAACKRSQRRKATEPSLKLANENAFGRELLAHGGGGNSGICRLAIPAASEGGIRFLEVSPATGGPCSNRFPMRSFTQAGAVCCLSHLPEV